MSNNTELLMGIGLIALAGLIAYAVYRWRQLAYFRRVDQWVKNRLRDRYQELPNNLSIHCTSDLLWPVLVGFDNPRTGIRHRLQFACAGPPSTWLLLSEKNGAEGDQERVGVIHAAPRVS